MKIVIKSFIKRYLYLYIAYFCSIAVFTLTLSLYDLPLEVILYPSFLSFMLLFFFTIHLFLKEYKHILDVDDFLKADKTFNCGYDTEQKLMSEIHKVRSAYKELKYDYELQFKENNDFYELWVHQIKEPLTAIKLLLEDNHDLTLKGEILKVEQYLNMILSLSRLAKEDSDLYIKEVDLDKVIKKVLSTYSLLFIQKGIKLNYDETKTMVISDEKWLDFIVGQIISNALKYTKSGYITISYSEGVLSIEDSGMGIASDDLPRIFEKGYTGKIGRLSRQSTGLGLFFD